ncbi:hypothetical protein ALC62_09754, partial [Cyphomyrmex costatus]
VYTCGICEEICNNFDAVRTHPCIESYEDVVVDNNNYFYPRCSNGEIVRRSDVNGAEAIVVDSAPLSTTIHQLHKPAQSLQSTNVDEILITEVHSRELLWNQHISIAKRDRRTIEKLWEEVSKATNGNRQCKQML